MNQRLEQLIINNRNWAKKYEAANPGIFNKLAKQQKPDYLWIGCSDSRVPANTIIGLQPGEVFVHRNVGNLVNHSDLNALSVLEYAVKIVGVTDTSGYREIGSCNLNPRVFNIDMINVHVMYMSGSITD
jgi:carbonic anhydrase